MPREKKELAEQIIPKLREVQVEVGSRSTVPSVSPSFNHRLLLVAGSTLAEVPLTGLSLAAGDCCFLFG